MFKLMEIHPWSRSWTNKRKENSKRKIIGLTVLRFTSSSLLLFGTLHALLQHYFGADSLRIHFTDTNSFVLKIWDRILSYRPKKSRKKIKYLDYRNLKKHPELYKTTKEKVTGKLKNKTSKTLDVEKCCALKAKNIVLNLMTKVKLKKWKE